MKKISSYGLTMVSLAGFSPVMASCVDDRDCLTGVCLVARGYENRCASHPPLVNIGREAERFQVPLSERSNWGYACQFNVDCQPGFACYKKNAAAVEGQCLQPSSLSGADDIP